MSSVNSPAVDVSPYLPCHHVVGLEYLFHEPGQDNFPVGCTMVLSGPPGAGKTTFALGLVRSMLLQADKPTSPPDPTGTAETDAQPCTEENVGGEDNEADEKGWPKHIVYYISTEVNRDRLRRMFVTRGWFAAAGDDRCPEDFLFAANPDPGRTSGLHVINPPLEIERPVKSSEELVNFIVRQIAVQPPPKKGQLVFIVVDSITSLFKDTDRGESRRQVHELVHRLRGQFAQSTAGGSNTGRLGMIMMLSEQGIENIDSPGMETYVADFVFTLGLKSLPMGTRLRTLEVTKSQGANMMMGTHTWHILTEQSLERLVAGDSLKEKVREAVRKIEGWPKHPPQSKQAAGAVNDTGSNKPTEAQTKVPIWGTIMVASRPYFHPFKETGPGSSDSQEVSSGICGLDEMLRFDPDYWFMDPQTVISERQKHFFPSDNQDDDNRVHTSIKPGSVTMLVGEPGTGKTSLCYHLIASHLALNKKEDSSNPSHVALLVGFEHDFSLSFKKFGQKFNYGRESGDDKKKGHLGHLEEGDLNNCELIYRPRSGLHFNLLLLELRTWLAKHSQKNKRVVIDGISHLVSTQTRQDFSQMLDALVALFAEYPQEGGEGAEPSSKATLFLTYEAMQNNSVLDPDTLRLPAHNIIAFTHKVIEDMRRTAVTVIKSSQPEYDNMVRELVLDHENPSQTHIRSGFDAYSGLLGGRVRNAEVVLQLFQENDREEAYNLALKEHLKELLPYQTVLRDFSRFDLTSAMDGKGEHVKVPGGDVLVAHTDEWWLAHKVQVLEAAAKEARKLKKTHKKSEAEAWRRFRMFVADNHLTKLAGFVGVEDDSPISPGDFWCFEMEKAWAHCETGDSRKDIGPYGLPSYLDFGMLCVHRRFKPAEHMPQCHIQYTTWDTCEKLPWDVAPWTEKRPDEDAENMVHRRRYAALLEDCMVPWCEPAAPPPKAGAEAKTKEAMWFKKPEPRKTKEGRCATLVDWMKSRLEELREERKEEQEEEKKKPGAGKSRPSAVEVHYGFAWDSRTPETAACFLYELAWAFGGPYDLFASEKQVNQQAVSRALRFIGFLVHERLMPVCPTLTDTSQSVFSRHYFSTYTDVVNRRHMKPAKTKSDKMHLPPKVENAVLVSLGFMPPGPGLWQNSTSIEADRDLREEKLTKRRERVEKIAHSMAASAPIEEPTTVPKKKQKKQGEWHEVRNQSQFQNPKLFTYSPNPHDVDELENWRQFRDTLERTTSWSAALGTAAEIASGHVHLGKKRAVKNSLRTGYGCCGAWVVGIKSPTGAPGLAQVLLQEITSLNFAKKRARMGAGMPARQDFYHYYGDRPVTGMEYLTWSEMLMCLGSRSRRRDRVYAPPYASQPSVVMNENAARPLQPLNDPAKMHRLIHHAVTEIMHVAARAPEGDPSSIIKAAGDLAKTLFNAAANKPA